MTKSLFVGNLPWSITDEDITAEFEKHVPVVSARIIMNRETGKSRGFAFVDVEESDVAKAVSALNGSKLGEREIVVNEARPRA